MKDTLKKYFTNSDYDEYTDKTSDMDDEMRWIDWFLNIKGNEVLVEVDSDYIRDSFNLIGLQNSVIHFGRALNIILDQDDEPEDLGDTEENGESDSLGLPPSTLMIEAQLLYGLIHARYILMHKGMEQMLEKYSFYVFGPCPNVSCKGRPVLPIGLSDTLGVALAKVFCPRCNEIYTPSVPRLNRLDGAFFGTSFAHLFFMYYQHLIPDSPTLYFVPKIFGFNVWNGLRDVLRVEEEESSEKKKIGNYRQPDAISIVLASGNYTCHRQQSITQKATEDSEQVVTP